MVNWNDLPAFGYQLDAPPQSSLDLGFSPLTVSARADPSSPSPPLPSSPLDNKGKGTGSKAPQAPGYSSQAPFRSALACKQRHRLFFIDKQDKLVKGTYTLSFLKLCCARESCVGQIRTPPSSKVSQDKTGQTHTHTSFGVVKSYLTYHTDKPQSPKSRTFLLSNWKAAGL